jgi:uncharacterized protein YwgA
MILIGKTKVNGKQFSMGDSDGTVYPKQLGLEDNWYGGYVEELRKTVYGIFLCIDRQGNVINLGYTDKSLTDKGRELLGIEKVEPEEPELDIDSMDRDELIPLAKKLGIEGKLATFKTAVLKEEIKKAQK